MARRIGRRIAVSRRERTDLQLTTKGLEAKTKKKNPPGQHGDKSGRATDYGTQLRMKQLIKRYYGVLEKQFRNYYEKAERQKGATGYNLLKLLESRLDNVVFRLGFASTRAEARQLVTHKAILVNGKNVNVPSSLVFPDDAVEIIEKARGQARIAMALKAAEQVTTPEWLARESDSKGVYKRYPDLGELPQIFKVHLVVEHYSK